MFGRVKWCSAAPRNTLPEIIGREAFTCTEYISGCTIEFVVKIQRFIIDAALGEPGLNAKCQELPATLSERFVISHGQGNLGGAEIHYTYFIGKKLQSKAKGIIAVIFTRGIKTQVGRYGK
jgi:hypothetical protein